LNFCRQLNIIKAFFQDVIYEIILVILHTPKSATLKIPYIGSSENALRFEVRDSGLRRNDGN
jgi:hypothetical protein